MISRLLPIDEWEKLKGTELESVFPHLDPHQARVVVIEEGDKIVGCWSGFPLWHAEGVYIARDHRGKGAVARLLLDRMRQVSQEAGYRSIVTASIDPAVDRLLEKLGAVSLPGMHYALPVSALPERKAG